MNELLKEIRYACHNYIGTRMGLTELYDIPVTNMKYLRQFRAWGGYRDWMEDGGSVPIVCYYNFLYAVKHNMAIKNNQLKLKNFGADVRRKRNENL